MTDITNIEDGHAYQQKTDEPRPAVASLEEISLSGEPVTDRAFVTPTGTRFRARIIRAAEIAARAPVNGEADLAPSQMTLSLSLALLDDDDAVAKDSEGRFIITDAHEIIIAPALITPKFSLREAIDQELRKAAFDLEKQMHYRNQVDDFMNGAWG
ncbi:MAG: hypothetical protein U5K75_10995 [Ahrensia sp.]|nr:hypothetical protein [Ahrensia sp.]